MFGKVLLETLGGGGNVCVFFLFTPQKIDMVHLRIHPWKRKLIFQTIIFRFELLIFGGCKIDLLLFAVSFSQKNGGVGLVFFFFSTKSSLRGFGEDLKLHRITGLAFREFHFSKAGSKIHCLIKITN